ncbi:MAG: ABC transporter permease [Candidatus Aminicenantes bacterium]|nr:ABC transporter permease [Candidatus Aminicenantes bacterium]
MLKNYIKTALRNIRKQKGYSLINIMGLAIGLASCLLILLYVRHELSYDSYHEHADRIYRVVGSFRLGGVDLAAATAPAPAAKALIEDYPEVEDAVRFRDSGSFIVQYGENSFREQQIVFADPSFFGFFAIPLIKGNSETALTNPNTLIMSRKTAEKYFGNDEPLGKTVRLDNNQDYKVTGVFDSIPSNTHFHFEILLSMPSLEESKEQTWFNNNFNTYILLNEKADWRALEAKFPAMLKKYMGPQVQLILGKTWDELIQGDMKAEFFLQPLRDIHLHSDLVAELEPNSDITYVYIFSAIALLVLLIASINFMNLSTARSAGRSKEVGIRKVLGSHRKQLIKQFLTEAAIYSIISLALALLLVKLVLPLFNAISGKEFTFIDLIGGSTIAALLVITFLTGFMAGCYPAFFISAFRPANVLKGKLKTGIKTGPLRSGLVVFQFATSVILIIGTVIVYSQLQFIQNKKLGYAKDQVLVLKNTYLLGNQAEVFKNEMLALPQFLSGTISGFLPTPSNRNNTTVFPEGRFEDEHTTSIQIWSVDYDYIPTLGMTILEGRNFSREYGTDIDAAIVNETAVKQYGWDSALGKRVSYYTTAQGDTKNMTIIGVLENFHFESLRNTIGPLLVYLGKSNEFTAFRINTENLSGAIDLMRKKWQAMAPNQPFEYAFMDDQFDDLYKAEQRIGKIFNVFAVLVILIGCLGLFGLSAFTAEQKTKEIGIRKVLGATVSNIIRLLLKEFVILIGIANLIAWPVAYFLMRRWLADFAYRISPSILVFLFAGTGTLMIALLTVSFQALKAAYSDPVKSLKYE